MNETEENRMSTSDRLDKWLTYSEEVLIATHDELLDPYVFTDERAGQALTALRAVLRVCDRTDASIEPRGDFETGQASVTATVRAVIAAALGEET